MDGVQFAQSYAGETWIISAREGGEVSVIVRGYFIKDIHRSLVVITPYDHEKKKVNGPIHNYEVMLLPEGTVVNCISKSSVSAHNYNGPWHEYYYCSTMSFLRPGIQVPVVAPYPSVCRHCRKPARKLDDGSMLCSNTRCKSWRKVRMRSNVVVG